MGSQAAQVETLPNVMCLHMRANLLKLSPGHMYPLQTDALLQQLPYLFRPVCAVINANDSVVDG